MANSSANFCAQGNALLRKNLTFQSRNVRSNIRLILIPVVFFALFGGAQYWVDEKFKDSPTLPEVRNPPATPALLQVPSPRQRAVRTDSIPFADLPDPSCLKTNSCPVTVLLTGNNRTLGKSFGANLFTTSAADNSSKDFDTLAYDNFGSDVDPRTANDDNRYVADPALATTSTSSYIFEFQPRCTPDFAISAAAREATNIFQLEVACVQALNLWRNSSSQINDELFKGFHKGNSKGEINEIMIAYDLLNSDAKKFNVSIWYNSTYQAGRSQEFPPLRVPRSVNLASNAFLQSFLGPASRILFDFLKEMPKPASKTKPDISAQFGTVFYTWIIVQLFPVILTSLVYEKQQKLRIIMKMHGLGDGPYWLISYAYFLAISSFYMLCFVGCGTILGFRFFTFNDYGIQIVFYFTYINVQIAFAFLVAAIFSNVKTATVIAYILVFATGLVGFLFQSFIEDPSFPRNWIMMLELYPGFSLYRGIYEFGEYSTMATLWGIDGMKWVDLSDSANGMREVLIIMAVEWFVMLFVAYYVDQVVSAGGGVRRSPLFFLKFLKKKPQSSIWNPGLQRDGSEFSVQMDKIDVAQEREKVEQLLLEQSKNHAIICDCLKKVYPGKDGNPDKFAVKGLSLALPRGECFGMLGPNGAGKTSFISMMIGLTEPSAGTAYVQGLDIRTDMDGIYTSMGVCPQHDLLWETLTGREHLLFYGRLKNLRGAELTQAVEESLKSVNLFSGGVADKQAGKYSGGMKRRLSVAISLIGDPKVVYMDEPSTGLDPASRNMLWNVVKRAKQDRAIILTTHSMEEAEYLCDRLGIFVDGGLQCLGNPNELKGRYGGSYVFTMTTSSNHEEDVEDLVRRLSPGAVRTYHIPGTQKFELPKNEVNIADVFEAVEDAKKRFTVQAWGLADTTLEDVFIKVAREAQAFKVLS